MKKLVIELNRWARYEVKEDLRDYTPCGKSRLCNFNGSMCCLGHLEHKLNNIPTEMLHRKDYPSQLYNRSITEWECHAVTINDNHNYYNPEEQRSKLIDHFKNRPEEEGGPIELEFVEA